MSRKPMRPTGTSHEMLFRGLGFRVLFRVRLGEGSLGHGPHFRHFRAEDALGLLSVDRPLCRYTYMHACMRVHACMYAQACVHYRTLPNHTYVWLRVCVLGCMHIYIYMYFVNCIQYTQIQGSRMCRVCATYLRFRSRLRTLPGPDDPATSPPSTQYMALLAAAGESLAPMAEGRVRGLPTQTGQSHRYLQVGVVNQVSMHLTTLSCSPG